MLLGACSYQNCTVQTTGKCLLSVPDPNNCSNFSPSSVLQQAAHQTDLEEPLAEETPTKVEPPASPLASVSARTFAWGYELGTSDALQLMQARYTHLIGVLGTTDAGKTCFLSSLYLMASNRLLPEPYRFAGCLSLQAFEDRVRGLRQWESGALANQLVDHTILDDPRQPSLLHLALRESNGERKRFDLLLTDLPGEWTDNLIDSANNASSFEFLQRADGIVLVIDGNRLLSDDRHLELQNMRIFCERLAQDVGVALSTPIIILVSKADEIESKMPPHAIELEDFIKGLGFPARTILCAAISRTPKKIPNGTGVFEAIEAIIASATNERFPAAVPPASQPVRCFQKFGVRP